MGTRPPDYLNNDMIKTTTLALFLLAPISGCISTGAIRTLTVQQTKDWYQENYVEQPAQPRPFVSELYYRGSDVKYHYFVSRFMDEWVFIKISVDDLNIADLRPEWTYSSQTEPTRSFGYYPVNPLKNFEKTNTSNQ